MRRLFLVVFSVFAISALGCKVSVTTKSQKGSATEEKKSAVTQKENKQNETKKEAKKVEEKKVEKQEAKKEVKPKTEEEFLKAYVAVECAVAKETDKAKKEAVKLEVLKKYGYTAQEFAQDMQKYGTKKGDQMKMKCMPVSALPKEVKDKYLKLAAQIECLKAKIKDTNKLKEEEDKALKAANVTQEDYDAMVSALKKSDKEFAKALVAKINQCVKPKFWGNYMGIVKMGNKTGKFTLSIDHNKLSGRLMMAGNVFMVKGVAGAKGGLTGLAKAANATLRFSGKADKDGKYVLGFFNGFIKGKKVTIKIKASRVGK